MIQEKIKTNYNRTLLHSWLKEENMLREAFRIKFINLINEVYFDKNGQIDYEYFPGIQLKILTIYTLLLKPEVKNDSWKLLFLESLFLVLTSSQSLWKYTSVKKPLWIDNYFYIK